MTPSQCPDTPADVAAVRSEIEAEIAGSTLLTAYAETVAGYPGTVAHWWEAGGEWHSRTYRETYDLVRDASLGLAEIGLRPGEFAMIWSRNRPEATIADYAVMHARGVPVFIYPTVAAEQAAYVIGHCAATVAFVEPEFLGSLTAVADQLPALRRIIVLADADADADASPGPGPGAGPDGTAEGLIGWPALLGLGAARAARQPGLFEETWRQVTPGDLATLIYTSGTTGTPKGVMLTHGGVRYTQAASQRVIPLSGRTGADGVARLVSFLPMAHVTGRHTDHWSAMAAPVTLAYCPDLQRIFQVAAHVHPTTMVGVPRIWEKLHAALRVALPDPGPAAVRALPAQVKAAVLARVGLDSCAFAATGSAPIDPEIIEFFQALGVPLTEGWGMSELTNAATIAAPHAARNGAVGQAFPGVEVRVAEDGEICVRGPLVMTGYYNDQAQTAATIDADGWLHTGDIGELDADGYLKITDRKKELLITSGGKNISPALVEYELQRHPLISQACAIGDRRNYVTALLVLDQEAAMAWATEHGAEVSSVADLAAHPGVLAEVERGVAAANSRLARPERVRRYHVLPDEWTPQTGELTPTLKRRRRVIISKYAKEIEALYE